MKIKIKKLRPDVVIPKYATPGSSGFDFVALEHINILPGETKLVKTGLSFEILEGFELQIRPRSGVSLNSGLRVANAPGTVDFDFRGEVCVLMWNSSHNLGWSIEPGDKIAQGVICPIIQGEFEIVDKLENTIRGEGAFGSTG